jgi:hypothetical protein
VSDAAPAAPPTLVFVSGFLGSGKTTAIVGLCRLLAARGVKTAIVTNDQGRHQVDLAFARAEGVPAVAVAGGCLCCRYDDFEDRVRELTASARPQVVFAEAVGSCTDLVATVARPFEAFRERHGAEAGHLATFVDVRLLEAFLAGRRLPFGERVLYLFERQLAEADGVVVNQRDRLPPERAQAVLAAARERWPQKPMLLASALHEPDLLAWYARVAAPRAAPRADVEVDYARYAAGELELAWLDRELRLHGAGDLGDWVVVLVEEVARRLRAAGSVVGHLKAHARGEAGEAKLGIVAGDIADDAASLDAASGDGCAEEGVASGRVSVQRVGATDVGGAPALGSNVDLLLNVRAVGDPEALEACVDAAVDELVARGGVAVETLSGTAFRPGVPRPRHRFAEGERR